MRRDSSHFLILLQKILMKAKEVTSRRRLGDATAASSLVLPVIDRCWMGVATSWWCLCASCSPPPSSA